jgi:hypothetical protein
VSRGLREEEAMKIIVGGGSIAIAAALADAVPATPGTPPGRYASSCRSEWEARTTS